MKKLLLIPLLLVAVSFLAPSANTQSSEFQTAVVSGTADVLIDSTLTTSYMSGRRVYINGIYAWWDNGANTNQVFVEVVRGQSAMATQGLRRAFKYSEAMTSGGIKGVSFPGLNITTGPDSTIYFVINAASSDSLYMAVNYKLVN